MMLGNVQGRPASLSETQQISHRSDSIIGTKIWLPKLLYDALPYFYLFSGIIAFLATLYISAWFWVLPHYVIFSAACLHLGILIFRRRHRKKSGN